MKTAKIISAILILVMLTACGQKDNRLYCSQTANGSSGKHWEYKTDQDGILKAVDYYESRGFLNFGPGYIQRWVFEPIEQGEVTINWISYKAGDIVVESECYHVIYNVDENMTVTKIFDSRYSD